MAANIALIRGAAMAAPKFTDIRGAVEPGIQTFKNIQALRQKEKEENERIKEREEAAGERLYANFPAVQDSVIPDNFKNLVSSDMLSNRDTAKNLIANKSNMDQFEFIDQYNDLGKNVDNVNADFQAYKEWSANWIALKEEGDLSSAMSAAQRKEILDILEGNATPIKMEGGYGYKLDNGKEVLLKDLPKPIAIEYQLANKMETDMLNLGAKFGAQGRGVDDTLYQQQKDLSLRNLRRGLTRDKALSLATDFLKIAGEDGEIANEIQMIIDDPEAISKFEYNDPVFKKMSGLEAFKEYIVDQYGEIADNTITSEKKKYDDNLKLKAASNTGKIEPETISGYNLAQNLIFNPVERFKEITNMPTSFDENTGVFSYEEEVEDGKTQTVEYNMTSAPDIIRLARSILDNEGETAANKSKIMAGLKEFLLKNKTQLEAMNDFYEEVDRNQRVNSVIQELNAMEDESFIPPHQRQSTDNRGSGARARRKSNN